MKLHQDYCYYLETLNFIDLMLCSKDIFNVNVLLKFLSL